MSVPSWAKFGAKVACVDANFYGHGSLRDARKLIVGTVYTISHVIPTDIGLCAVLCEIQTESLGYMLSRFRPLVTRTQEQDVEMFLRLANDTPIEVMS